MENTFFNDNQEETQQDFDYFQDEIDQTVKQFDLEFILSFQLKHDIQIIRGEDWMYECWIDRKCYDNSLTPMYALVFGIENYLKQNNKKS